jgi:glyoxylase-like metal-dependent hydrolase (beta-lactamase superfamily II)
MPVWPTAHGEIPREKTTRPFKAYAIKGGEENILVDTGPPTVEEFMEFDKRTYDQEDGEKLENALEKYAGWSADDVDVVVNTHLHADHCSGNEKLPNARIYIQRRELRQAAAPMPHEKGVYYVFMGNASYTRTDTRIINGDYRLNDDVELLLTPGHTWEFQSLLVRSGKKKLVIASDLIPDLQNWDTGLCAPITSFPHHWYKSFARLKALKPDFVLPGHDMKAFKKKSYP